MVAPAVSSGYAGVTAVGSRRMGVACMNRAPGCVRGMDSSRAPASRSALTELEGPRTTVVRSSMGVPSPRANTTLVIGVAGGPGRFEDGRNSAARTESRELPPSLSEKVTLRSVVSGGDAGSSTRGGGGGGGMLGRGRIPCGFTYTCRPSRRVEPRSRSEVEVLGVLRGVLLNVISRGEGDAKVLEG